MRSFIFVMILIVFLGCVTNSPKEVENKTKGDTMAQVKKEAPEEIVEVMIKEYESASIGAWNVKVNSIFMHSGVIKADLKVNSALGEIPGYEPPQPMGAPPYFGHKKGDGIAFGAATQPTYIKEIMKFGRDKAGYVIISIEKPAEAEPRKCEEQIFLEKHAGEPAAGFKLGEIRKIEGTVSAELFYDEFVSNNEFHFFAYENDTVWLGECAYNVEEIIKKDGGDEYVKLKFLEVTDMAEKKKGKEPEGKKTTVKGIAQEAKSGLEVGGVFLVGLPYGEIEKYRGKFIEVMGYVLEAPELVAEPYEKGKPISQGFQAAPLVMRNIVSIKVLKK